MEFRHPTEFRAKSTFGVAIAGLLFLTPFSVNNFIQGRYLLGGGSLAIVVILALSGWSNMRGRYYPLPTFVGLVPAAIFFLDLSLRKQGTIGAYWCYPALLSFYIMLPERQAWIANGALLAVVLPESWHSLDPTLASRVTATLLAVSIFSVIFVRVITIQQKLLNVQAVTDHLTGLNNRKLLHSTMEQAVLEGHRAQTPMSVIMLDLDHFKRINDTLGHDAGDNVLRGVADLLRSRIRRSDSIFRLGGEEFLVLLRGTDQEAGSVIAEELRNAVSSLPLLPDRNVTASIGIATLQTDEDWVEWMKRGDENLYRAKAEGRNRVVA